MDPIRHMLDWKLTFLEEMSGFLEAWQNSSFPALTKETFIALRQTTVAVKELSLYLINEVGFNHVLTAKFLSDDLERRFSCYRMRSGGNYYISLKDILYSERKIKALSLIKFNHLNFNESNLFDDDVRSDIDEDVSVFVEKLTFESVCDENDLNIFFYLAGYISHSINKSVKCLECKSLTVSQNELVDDFFFKATRGGLKQLTEFVFDLTTFCWNIFCELKSDDELFSNFVCANALFKFTSIIFQTYNNLYVSHCDQGHALVTKIIQKFFNCAMKNTFNEIQEHTGTSRKIIKLSSA